MIYCSFAEYEGIISKLLMNYLLADSPKEITVGKCIPLNYYQLSFLCCEKLKLFFLETEECDLIPSIKDNNIFIFRNL